MEEGKILSMGRSLLTLSLEVKNAVHFSKFPSPIVIFCLLCSTILVSVTEVATLPYLHRRIFAEKSLTVKVTISLSYLDVFLTKLTNYSINDISLVTTQLSYPLIY